jgi:predicted transcriptional regulator
MLDLLCDHSNAFEINCLNFSREKALPHSPLQPLEKARSEGSHVAQVRPDARSALLPSSKEHPVTEESEQINLAVVTAEIVSAYVAHNQIATPDLVTLVGAVAAELRKFAATAAQPAAAGSAPAVSVRHSIRPDHLVCLVCGKKKKLLKRHLKEEHTLTAAEYRDTFRLKPDYPMVAPSYRKQRRELALKSRLGQPKQSRPAPEADKGSPVPSRRARGTRS